MNLIEWLEQHQLPCLYKQNFGIDCFGCGMQRAFIALLKGNFLESFMHYPPLVPMILMLLLLPLHLIFKFKHGAAWLKYLFIFNIGIVIINFAIKLFA